MKKLIKLMSGSLAVIVMLCMIIPSYILGAFTYSSVRFVYGCACGYNNLCKVSPPARPLFKATTVAEAIFGAISSTIDWMKS